MIVGLCLSVLTSTPVASQGCVSCTNGRNVAVVTAVTTVVTVRKVSCVEKWQVGCVSIPVTLLRCEG